jgi:hypothetical protein
VTTPGPLKVIRGALAFTAKGTHLASQTLVSGSGDATVRLWDTFPVARRLQARRAAANAEIPGQ